jgi:hypothetical protein
MKPTSDHIRAALEQAALGANDALDRERAKLTDLTDPAARHAQQLRVQAAAVEAQRCLDALFASEPSNCRT